MKFLLVALLAAVASSENLIEEPSTQVAQVGDIIDCVKEKCPTQYAACEADSKCLPALQACETKCGTSQSCWTFCLAGKGDSNATNVAKCAASAGCV